MDQKYKHTVLIRKNTAPSVTKMNMLLDKLVQSGEYKKILQKYGMERYSFSDKIPLYPL